MKFNNKPVILILLQSVSLTCVQSSEGGGGLLDGMIQPILKQFRKISSTEKEISGLGMGTSNSKYSYMCYVLPVYYIHAKMYCTIIYHRVEESLPKSFS